MKKIISKVVLVLLIITISATTCLFFACTKKGKTVQLSTPQNLEVVGNSLRWDAVENATEYVITFQNKEDIIYTNQFVFPDDLPVGEYQIKIYAAGDIKKYLDSDTVTYTHVVEAPTEALVYNLLPDGTGYEVTRKNFNHEGLGKRIVIPDFYNGLPVLKIADKAFDVWVNGYERSSANSKTESFKLPAYLKEIGSLSFSLCNELKSIEMPVTVIKIGQNAFDNCLKLESVKLSNNLTTLPQGIFYCCKNLMELQLPETITEINQSAFTGCDKLTSIELPVGLKKIERMTFFNCAALKEIVLPLGLEVVEQNAFLDCPKLTRLYYKGTKEQWEQIDNYEMPENLANKYIYYYSEQEPPVNNANTGYKFRAWHYDVDGKTPVIWEYPSK